MADSTNRTLVCSILFLDIGEYSRRPVAEQLQLKTSFNDIVTKALGPVPARDRIVLDTGDGAALTFLGDPEDALAVSMEIRDAAAAQQGLALRMGVNLGPVRLVRDVNSRLNIIGDGINVAQRVMGFASPGQLLVSRSFYEVVSCLSREYSTLFEYVGARTDKHVREHEVYLVGRSRPLRHVPEKSDPGLATRAVAALTAPGPFGLVRATFLVAGLVFSVIVGAAAQIKYKRDMIAAPEPLAEPAAKAPARKAAAQVARAENGATPSGKSAAAGAGQLQLNVMPWGEVVIDGKSRGVSPPLKVLDLPVGSHTVEIRNTGFAPHFARVDVRAGEKLPIHHRFK